MKYQVVVLTPLDLNSLNGLAKIVPTLLGISLKDAKCSFAINPDLERQDCFKEVEDYLEFSTYCSHCGTKPVSVNLEEKFKLNNLFIDPFDCLEKNLPTIIIHSEEIREYEQMMIEQFKELLDYPHFISSSKILSLL